MRRLVILLLELYRKRPVIFPTKCVYVPSCSAYAKEAFMRFSFAKALWLTCFRIIRCNPFSKGGFDPVK